MRETAMLQLGAEINKKLRLLTNKICDLTSVMGGETNVNVDLGDVENLLQEIIDSLQVLPVVADCNAEQALQVTDKCVLEAINAASLAITTAIKTESDQVELLLQSILDKLNDTINVNVETLSPVVETQLTTLITNALEAAVVNVNVDNFADIQPYLQAALQWAADNLQFTVLAKQDGTWTVNLTQATIDALQASLEAALGNVVVDVNVTGGNITATLDQATLDALEEINVNIISSIPIDISAQSIADFIAALEAATLNVTGDVNAQITGLTAQAILDFVSALEQANLNATVTGSVDINQASIDALVAALQGLNVVVSGSVDANITAIDPQVLADLVAALELGNYTVTVDGGNLTVSVDGFSATALAELQGILEAALGNVSFTGNVTIDPQSIADLIAALEAATITVNGTVDITSIDPAVLAQLQAVIEAALNNVTVSVVGSVSIDPSSITELVTALQGLNVNATVNGVVEIDPISITAIAQAIAGENLQVTITNTPLEITGTIDIGNWNVLTDWLAANSIEVTSSQLADLLAALNTTVTTESNQVESLLQTIIDTLTATCENAINTKVCNTVDVNINSVGQLSSTYCAEDTVVGEITQIVVTSGSCAGTYSSFAELQLCADSNGCTLETLVTAGAVYYCGEAILPSDMVGGTAFSSGSCTAPTLAELITCLGGDVVSYTAPTQTTTTTLEYAEIDPSTLDAQWGGGQLTGDVTVSSNIIAVNPENRTDFSNSTLFQPSQASGDIWAFDTTALSTGQTATFSLVLSESVENPIIVLNDIDRTRLDFGASTGITSIDLIASDGAFAPVTGFVIQDATPNTTGTGTASADGTFRLNGTISSINITMTKLNTLGPEFHRLQVILPVENISGTDGNIVTKSATALGVITYTDSEGSPQTISLNETNCSEPDSTNIVFNCPVDFGSLIVTADGNDTNIPSAQCSSGCLPSCDTQTHTLLEDVKTLLAANTQAIVDLQFAINSGVTVEPSTAWSALLETAFTNALQAGTIDVNVTNSPLSITGNVTINGQPIEVSGTVAVTQSGVWTVSVDNFPTTLAISNFADLVGLLESSTGLNVTVDALPPITIEGTQFQTLLDALVDLDDTNDDVRPITPQCYTGDNGNFFGYAQVNEIGAFIGWVTLSGIAPTNPTSVSCPTTPITVVDTMKGCVDDGSGGSLPAYWLIYSDGTTSNAILASTLPQFKQGAC